MYKNILIPTDGSVISGNAAKAGIQLAKHLGAKVIGFYAVEPAAPHVYGEGYAKDGTMGKTFEKRAREIGEKYIDGIAQIAAEQGVGFSGVVAVADSPYEGIIATAKKNKCDVIFMASNGRRGLRGLLMGSVTQKVLTHTKIPVLVYR